MAGITPIRSDTRRIPDHFRTSHPPAAICVVSVAGAEEKSLCPPYSPARFPTACVPLSSAVNRPRRAERHRMGVIRQAPSVSYSGGRRGPRNPTPTPARRIRVLCCAARLPTQASARQPSALYPHNPGGRHVIYIPPMPPKRRSRGRLGRGAARGDLGGASVRYP